MPPHASSSSTRPSSTRRSRRRSRPTRKQQAQLQAQQQAQVAPAAPAGDDLIEKLKQLGDLKAAGVLSDAEFAAAKAKLLG